MRPKKNRGLIRNCCATAWLTPAEDRELQAHLKRMGRKVKADWLREAIGEKIEREGALDLACQ